MSNNSKTPEEKIEQHLTEKYYLLPKGKAWYFLGGCAAAIVALGIFNWGVAQKAAKGVIDGSVAKTTTEEIIGYKESALMGLQNIDIAAEEVEAIANSLKSPDNILGWTIVYKTDVNGIRVDGNLSSLIDAIGRGADVKLSFTAKAKETDHKNYMSCEWTFVTPKIATSTEEDIVSCMNSSHVSIQRDGGGFSFRKDAYRWIVLADSTGAFNMTRWFFEGGKKHDANTDKREMEWFVKMM